MSDNNYNVAAIFEQSALSESQKIALIHNNEQISYEELLKEVKSLAGYLKLRGVKQGDRVLIFLRRSINLYKTILSVLYLGATAVFVDEWADKKRLKQSCEVADVKAVVASRKFLFYSMFYKVIRKIPIKISEGNRKVSASVDLFIAKEDDSAIIAFTTGSTGLPKAVNRTHGVLSAQYSALLDKNRLNPIDNDITVFPIVLLVNLGIGATTVIADFNSRKPDTLSPEGMYKSIIKYNVSRMSASPFVMLQLAEYLQSTNQQIDCLKKIVTGGAPVFPLDAKKIINAFPDAEIEVLYGSTEAEPIAFIDARESAKEELSYKNGLKIGTIYNRIKLRIIKISDEPVKLKENETIDNIALPSFKTGEIVVSGKHVMKRYFRSEGAFERFKIPDGENLWHRTGDAGYLNEKNELFLEGRCSSMILKNETYLSPYIYENIFKNIEGVALGTIVEVDKNVIAVIELLESGVKYKDSILQTIRDENSVLDDIVVINKIPRDLRHYSKINYEELKEIVRIQK